MINRSTGTVLPLGKMLAGALALLIERRQALAHVLALPWLIHVALDAWMLWAPDSAESALLAIVMLRMAVYVLLAVNVHRLILLGSHSVPPFGIGPFGVRELRYLGWSCAQILAAAFAVMLCAPLVALSQPLGLVVALLLASWIVGRMALLLPEVALERPLDVASMWRLGQGAGFSLAVIVVAVPLLAALLLFPLATSGIWLLQWIAIAGSLASVALAVSALSLAWRHLLQLRDGDASAAVGDGDDVRAIAAAGAPSVRLAPDAARGILEVEVAGSFSTVDLGHVASGDGLLSYHGRLRGLVIRLQGDGWEASEPAWEALDTLLAHLGFVRVHHEHLQRVALVGPGAWEALAERLGKHFAHAELRSFTAPDLEQARGWSAGEA